MFLPRIVKLSGRQMNNFDDFELLIGAPDYLQKVEKLLQSKIFHLNRHLKSNLMVRISTNTPLIHPPSTKHAYSSQLHALENGFFESALPQQWF